MAQSTFNPVVLSERLGFEEVFTILKNMFDLPLPPAAISEMEEGYEKDYFLYVKALYSFSRRHLNSAVREFQSWYNIATNTEHQMSSSSGARPTANREAKLRARRVQAFVKELKKQEQIVVRDGGSLLTETDSIPATRSAGLGRGGVADSGPAGLSEVQQRARTERRVMDWPDGGADASPYPSPNQPLNRRRTHPTLRTDQSSYYGDAEGEEYEELSTQVDDPIVLNNHIVSTSSRQEQTSTSDNIIPDEFYESRTHPSSSSKPSSKPLSKPSGARTRVPGAFPVSSTSGDSMAQSDRPPPPALIKSHTVTGHPVAHKTATRTEHPKPGNPAPAIVHNPRYGTYVPPDGYNPHQPQPRRTQQPAPQTNLQPSKTAASSNMTEFEMSDDSSSSKRKRSPPPQTRQLRNHTAVARAETDPPPSKRVSPQRKPVMQQVSAPPPNKLHLKPKQALPPEQQEQPGTFKTPALQQSKTAISMRSVATTNSFVTSTQPSNKLFPSTMASMSTNSFRRSGTFETPQSTAPTSFSSTNPGRSGREYPAPTGEDMDVDGDESGRFDDVDDSLTVQTITKSTGAVSYQKFDLASGRERASTPSAQLRLEEEMSIGSSTQRGMMELGIEEANVIAPRSAPLKPTPIRQPVVSSSAAAARQPAPPSTSAATQSLPCLNLPDPQLDASTPFWLRYEITKAILGTNAKEDIVTASQRGKELVTHIQNLEHFSVDDLRAQFAQSFGGYKADEKYAIDSMDIHTLHAILSSGEDWNNHIQMTGEVKFNGKRPTIRLRALKKQALTSRYTRHFGSDRFLVLRIPAPDKTAKKTGESHIDVLKKYILQPGFTLLGRFWRAFYYRDPNKRPGAVGKERTDQFSLIMFAERGIGLEEISIRQAVEWMIPVGPNLYQSEAKFFARISLAFSTTMNLIIFQPQDILELPDIPGVGDDVLTDGCGLASPAVFRAIKTQLGLDYLPSAFQGRIGPAKGMWIPNPSISPLDQRLQIWIRPSQSKFKGQSQEEEHRTLDVCKCAKALDPAALNLQFIPILLNNGVDRNTLADLLKEDIHAELGEVVRRLDDPQYLKGFIEHIKLERSRKDTGNLQSAGAFPQALAERIVALLDATFTLQDCSYLKENYFAMLLDYCSTLQEKMRIRVPRSTVALCVPDPTGILEEGEIYLRFSKPERFSDPETFLPTNVLSGPVLVGRNPAHTESDIQKVMAIPYVPGLEHLTDVIVFSVKGDRSLASYLSGGDYDGDTVWCTWEERLVSPFTNEPENLLIDSQKLHFSKVGCQMADTFRKRKCMIESHPSYHETFNDFMNRHLLIAMDDSKLGHCTSMFEKVAYRQGITSEDAKSLAALCCIFVDAPKQGDRIRDEAWQEIKKLYDRYPEPIYKRKAGGKHGTEKNIRDSASRSKNAIDWLKWVVGHELIQSYKEQFEDDIRDVPLTDRDLTKFYSETRDYYEATKRRLLEKDTTYGLDNLDQMELGYAQEILAELDGMNRALDNVSKEWSNFYDRDRSRGASSEPQTEAMRLKKANLSSELYDQILDILPSAEGRERNPVIREWARRADSMDEYCDWSLLRASALFLRNGGQKAFPWLFAGRQLCFLKLKNSSSLAGGVGGRQGREVIRMVAERMYLPMKTKRSVMAAKKEKDGLFEWEVGEGYVEDEEGGAGFDFEGEGWDD